MDKEENIYKELVNQIGKVLDKNEENDISIQEIEQDHKNQAECSENLEECLELVQNLSLEQNPDSINKNSNLDIIRIKSVIESIFKKNSEHLDQNVSQRLGNIDQKLDQLNLRLNNQDTGVIENKNYNLNDIRSDIFDEFSEIKGKINQVIDNNNDNLCTSKIKDVKFTVDELNDKLTDNNENFNILDLIKKLSLQMNTLNSKVNENQSETYIKEISNLNEKLNSILNKNDYNNENILQRVSLLGDKLNHNNNNDLYNEISTLSQKINRITNVNDDNNYVLINKLKEIINLIDNDQLKSPKQKNNNSDNSNSDNSNSCPHLNENEKQKLLMLEKNLKFLNDDQNNSLNNQKITSKNIKKIRDSNKIDLEEEIEENDFDEVTNNEKNYKFSKNKNPFDYIYSNTDGIVFKKKNMDGGARLEKLKQIRKKAVNNQTKKK